MAKKEPKTLGVNKSRGKRKLSDDQVLNIVNLFRGGTKRAELARQFGVTHGSITSLVKGQTYAWLTGIARAVAPAESQTA